MKYCKDCKHFKRTIVGNFCLRLVRMKEDPLFGWQADNNLLQAVDERTLSNVLRETCGLEAKFFEPLPEEKNEIEL